MHEGKKFKEVENLRSRFAEAAPLIETDRDPPRGESRMDDEHRLAGETVERLFGVEFLDLAIGGDGKRPPAAPAATRADARRHKGCGVGQDGTRLRAEIRRIVRW